MDTNEKWKPVLGYEGCYEVSNHGRIKSVERVVSNGGSGRTVKERIVSQVRNRIVGYMYAMLYVGNVGINKRVHAVVAEAFLGMRREGMVVNHKDGNKLNNHANNLEYVTQKANIRHAIDSGITRQQGELSVNAKMTDEQAREAYELYRSGERLADVAVKFGVSKTLIGLLVTGKRWRHLGLSPIIKFTKRRALCRS